MYGLRTDSVGTLEDYFFDIYTTSLHFQIGGCTGVLYLINKVVGGFLIRRVFCALEVHLAHYRQPYYFTSSDNSYNLGTYLKYYLVLNVGRWLSFSSSILQISTSPFSSKSRVISSWLCVTAWHRAVPSSGSITSILAFFSRSSRTTL